MLTKDQFRVILGIGITNLSRIMGLKENGEKREVNFRGLKEGQTVQYDGLVYRVEVLIEDQQNGNHQVQLAPLEGDSQLRRTVSLKDILIPQLDENGATVEKEAHELKIVEHKKPEHLLKVDEDEPDDVLRKVRELSKQCLENQTPSGLTN